MEATNSKCQGTLCSFWALIDSNVRNFNLKEQCSSIARAIYVEIRAHPGENGSVVEHKTHDPKFVGANSGDTRLSFPILR